MLHFQPSIEPMDRTLVEKTFGIGIGGVAWVEIVADVDTRITNFVGDRTKLLLECAQERLQKMQLLQGFCTQSLKNPAETSGGAAWTSGQAQRAQVSQQQRVEQINRIVDEFCGFDFGIVEAAAQQALVWRMLTILKSLNEKTTFVGECGSSTATRFSLLGLSEEEIIVMNRVASLAEKLCTTERRFHDAFNRMKKVSPILCRSLPFQRISQPDTRKSERRLSDSSSDSNQSPTQAIVQRETALLQPRTANVAKRHTAFSIHFRMATSRDGSFYPATIVLDGISYDKLTTVDHLRKLIAETWNRDYAYRENERKDYRQMRLLLHGGPYSEHPKPITPSSSLEKLLLHTCEFVEVQQKKRGGQKPGHGWTKMAKGKGKGDGKGKGKGKGADEVMPRPGVTVQKCSAGELTRLRQLWSMRGGSGQVQDAWKVDNPLRIHLFKKRREELKTMLGREADGVEGFHGTHPDAIISICENGLDESNQSHFVTKDPSKCLQDCSGGQYMLVCRLTLGNESSTHLNADGDHRWIAEQGCYVIKESEQVLPQYIIRFSTNAALVRCKILEDILSQTKWSTITEEVKIKPVPRQRKCCMSNPFTTVLWMGFLHGHLSDESLKDDVRRFIMHHARNYMEGMTIQIIKGHFKKAIVVLETPIPRDLVHKLNQVDFVEDGLARTIAVDDAHGSPGQDCPKFIAGYCRGQNLRFTHPCWCSHPPRVTNKAQYHLKPISLDSAKAAELIEKFTASGSFHNGTPRVVGINAIDNEVLSRCHEQYRGYLITKHMEEPAVQELYHGTNNNILDIIYTHGLQPPSDMQASDSCPISGGKGLCTSLCNNDCQYCTERHEWNQCHMFGLGIYLADSPQKSHHYVSQPRTDTHGRKTYRIVVCSVLGKSFQVEGHLRSKASMHDVVNVRAVTDEMMDDMVDRCQECFSSTGEAEGISSDNLEVAENSDLLFVKGLGPAARHTITNRIFDDVCNVRCGCTMKPGVSVLSNEYVAFHPHQCLPKYEIEYELE